MSNNTYRDGSVPEVNTDPSATHSLPDSPEKTDTVAKPRVLIAGGGIGGLTLAILLCKAKIPCAVFERTHDIKPLGSIIALGASISPLFRQLGIYEEFVAIGKRAVHVEVITENVKPVYRMDIGWLEEASNYAAYMVPRADLYDLLWRHVPRECILLGKRILSFEQTHDSVTITCSDKSSYEGDILVGADGAYSAVRQQLFKQLKLKGTLPASDDVPLPYSCVCLVGQTEVLDPEEFPDLKLETCKDYSVLGTESMFTWCTFTTKHDTICWMVIQFLDKTTFKMNDSFRNTEWGPEAALAMCKEVRHFKVPGGKDGKLLTLGDLIDRTPANLISKVMLEEKLFETWFGGRTVLLGDACHKMVPSSGQGATVAIQDAVTLANWIVSLQSHTIEDLDTIFKEYRAERYPVVRGEVETSQGFTNILGKNFRSLVVRAILKKLPAWIWRRIITRLAQNRPQASFLPLVEDNPPLKPKYQASLHKTRAILKHRVDTKKTRIPETSAPAVAV